MRMLSIERFFRHDVVSLLSFLCSVADVVLLLERGLYVSAKTEPFLNASCDRLSDICPLSVSEVEQQFFCPPCYFYPGMSPSIAAVESVFIGDVFDDIGGMLQREREFESLHGEDSSIALGSGFEVGGEVGGVFGQSDVVYLVTPGHDGEGRVEYHRGPKDAFEVGATTRTMVLTHGEEVASEVFLFDDIAQLAQGLWVVEEGIGLVPLLDHSSP